MDLSQLYHSGKPVLSFEVFPPRHEGALGAITETLTFLQACQPDFISVTFGANGGSVNTLEVARLIQSCGIEPLVHLTGLLSTPGDIIKTLASLRDNGISNVLALRGDRRPGEAPPQNPAFPHASQLAAFIRAQGPFTVFGACYPEGHLESESPESDLYALRQKEEAGVKVFISQLFFDNSFFYSFMDKARAAGVASPIAAGIMPVINKGQIERMVTLCGASLPPKFRRILERYEHRPEALRDAGLAYAIDQIVDLVSQNIPIHLYTMNNPQTAKQISASVASLIRE